MLIRETLRTAWRSLVTNRLRTALTALGMVIGVAAVVAVLAIAEGAKASVEGNIRSLGSNMMSVVPGRARSGAVRAGSVETLSRADADAIAHVPGVVAVGPECTASAQLRHFERNTSSSVVGITPEYLTIRSLNVERGLGFTPLDDEQRARVAILGAGLARTLFGQESPLGARIQIRGIGFRVVGVLAEKGESFSSPDDQLFVPLATHQGALFGTDHLTGISLSVADEGATYTVQDRVEQLLRLRHRLAPTDENDFEVRSQTEMRQRMSAVTGTLTALLASVAAVSLLVGGIGIMNIMLVSVRERTREIGILMAVGARRQDVLRQFLLEAVAVSFAGGLVGLVLGWTIAAIVGRLGGWETIVPAYAVVLALGVSIGVGLLFGVGPARRASRLDPVEALRQE